MRRVPRDRHSRLEPLTLVGLVLHCDSYWYRLQALEPRGRLEVRALLAAMERRAALGTVALKIDIQRKRGGAVITARGCYRLHHPRQARTGDFDGGPWTLRAGTLIAPGPAVAGIIAVGVLIAALPVLAFAFHKLRWLAYSFDTVTTLWDRIYGRSRVKPDWRHAQV